MIINAPWKLFCGWLNNVAEVNRFRCRGSNHVPWKIIIWIEPSDDRSIDRSEESVSLTKNVKGRGGLWSHGNPSGGRLNSSWTFTLYSTLWDEEIKKRRRRRRRASSHSATLLKINFGSCLQVAPLTCPNNIVIIAGSFTFRQHCARVSAWPCTSRVMNLFGA